MAPKSYMCLLIAWILTLMVHDIGAYFEAEINIVNLPSIQPSNFDDRGTADHGNDGGVDTHYEDGQTCTATAAMDDPWWQVDLRVYRNVIKVEVLNRGNCCPERLTDVTVWMANDTFTNNPDKVQCGFYQGMVASGEWDTITCDQPTLGRYMIIQRKDVQNDYLTVCEVKVHGRFENTLTRVASQSDENDDYPTLVSQYSSDGKQMLPDIDASLGANYMSLQYSEKVMYKSPVVDCSWSHILGVQLTVYRDEKAMMTLDFDTSSSAETKTTFYGYTYLRASTYDDLTATYWHENCFGRSGGYFSVEGHGPNAAHPHDRRFFLNCNYGGCNADYGWLVILDMDHEKVCDWEVDGGLNPNILFAETAKANTQRTHLRHVGIIGNFYCQYRHTATERLVNSSASTEISVTLTTNPVTTATVSIVSTYLSAHVMTLTAFMGDAFGGCVSDCNLMEDGDYQSCLACNIYVTCSSQTLKYNICPVGLEFDQEAESCISTSTTCHESGFAEEGCYPNGCSPTPCENDGVCSSDETGWECACLTGFEGDICETNINDCHNNTCLNGGNCTDGVNDFSCDCVDGFVDKDCGTNFDDCATNPCGDHGECDDQINGYECTCHDGFQGDDCEINVDECDSNPCQNDGTCSDGDNEYSCDCVQGFRGDDCSENIDDCDPDPCTNGAVCTDGVDEYTCACLAGYTGDDCTTNIDECASSPCLQNGTCTDGINKFTCACAAPYKGDTCDEIDGCDGNNPCQNGGNCTDADDSDSVDYTCTCADDYAGTTCQNHKICSASSPCENGECEDGENGTTYSCTCSEGYSGTNCDESSGAGSADAQSGNAGASALGGTAFVTYILIGAVSLAGLIIGTMCIVIIARRKKKKKEEEEEPKNGEDLNKNPNNQPPWATKIDDKFRSAKPMKVENPKINLFQEIDF